MSYIAVDTFGDEYIYQFKPKRVIRTNTLGEKWGYWYSEKGHQIEVPIYKRNMNWGDNPIQL